MGHGSRDLQAVGEFLDFARQFQEREKFEVACAFLELSKPSIPQALESLAQKGAKKIAVVPYFLFRAGHVKTEIPEMLSEFKKSHPQTEISYGDSLWPHGNLVQLAAERIQQGLDSFPKSIQEKVDVLVVGRGATDEEAIQQFCEACDELRHCVLCHKLRHCFIALAEPKYADVLAEMLQNGTRRLVIFPFYLFTGILVKRIETQALEAEKKFGDTTIRVLPHFGSHPLMFQMLKEKIEEIL